MLVMSLFGLVTCAAPSGPSATPDPLATPVMPANPSLVDHGREVYYYHCMPCHGDRGQGLTDEWRAVWSDDHQNCWARGCHAGRSGDAGFPIPRKVPSVAGVPGALARFATPDDLFDYLRSTQPPQEPGRLGDAEYRALAAFLLRLNGRSTVAPLAGVHAILAAIALLAGILFAKRLLSGRAPRPGAGPTTRWASPEGGRGP